MFSFPFTFYLRWSWGIYRSGYAIIFVRSGSSYAVFVRQAVGAR